MVRQDQMTRTVARRPASLYNIKAQPLREEENGMFASLDEQMKVDDATAESSLRLLLWLYLACSIARFAGSRL